MLSYPSIYMNRLKNYPFDVHVNDQIKKCRKRKPRLPKHLKRPSSSRFYFYTLEEKLTAAILDYFGDPKIQITLQTIAELSVAMKDEIMFKLGKEYNEFVTKESKAPNKIVEQSSVEEANISADSPGKKIVFENSANSLASRSPYNLSYDLPRWRVSLEGAASNSASSTISSDSSNYSYHFFGRKIPDDAASCSTSLTTNSFSYHALEKQVSVKDAENSSTYVTTSLDNSFYHPLRRQMSVDDGAHCSTSSDSSSYHPLEKQPSVEDATNSPTSFKISSDSSSHNVNSSCTNMDCYVEDNSELTFEEMLIRIKTLDCGEESRILTLKERLMLGTMLSALIRYSDVYVQWDLILLLKKLDKERFKFSSFMASVLQDFKCPASPPVKKTTRKRKILHL